jgi:hypothetical protein
MKALKFLSRSFVFHSPNVHFHRADGNTLQWSINDIVFLINDKLCACGLGAGIGSTASGLI